MSVNFYEFYDHDEQGYEPMPYVKSRHLMKLTAPKGKHVPNKSESKLLRKLMSTTGMTETEIRQHKTYRKMLSDAQKSCHGPKDAVERLKKKITKKITKKLKLAKEHPTCQAAIIQEIEDRLKGPYISYRNRSLLEAVRASI